MAGIGKLTPKQQRFVEEYLVDLNATQAAFRAGYKDPNIGRQLITKNNVLKSIELAQKARSARISRKASDVLDDIVKLTKEAWQTGDHKTALKGLELEGRHLGLFREKLDLSNSDGSLAPQNVINIDLSKMTPEELTAMVRAAWPDNSSGL